jgi:hypothetical protein
MRKAAAVAAVAVAALTAVGLAAPQGAPTLRLLSMRPLEVRGASFVRSERVVLRLTVDELPRTRVVTASRAGAFTVRFAGVSLDRCTAFRITARGSRGSRAVLKSRDLAECPQPQPEPPPVPQPAPGHGCFAFVPSDRASVGGGAAPSCHPVRVP